MRTSDRGRQARQGRPAGFAVCHTFNIIALSGAVALRLLQASTA